MREDGSGRVVRRVGDDGHGVVVRDAGDRIGLERERTRSREPIVARPQTHRRGGAGEGGIAGRRQQDVAAGTREDQQRKQHCLRRAVRDNDPIGIGLVTASYFAAQFRCAFGRRITERQSP